MTAPLLVKGSIVVGIKLKVGAGVNLKHYTDSTDKTFNWLEMIEDPINTGHIQGYKATWKECEELRFSLRPEFFHFNFSKKRPRDSMSKTTI